MDTEYTQRPAIRPVYYKSGDADSIEIIELIRDLPFSLGNSIKYVYRCRQKENREQDLTKALWYLEDHMKNESQIKLPKISDYMVIPSETMDILLEESDNFERSVITEIYDSFVENSGVEDAVQILREEIGKHSSSAEER